MNNFINVRLQAYNHVKQLNILKHNTRKIKSLSEQDKSKTNYIVLDDGELFDLEEEFAKDTFYNTTKNFYNNDRKEHNKKVYARRQRNLTTQQASWMEGVFTFSEAIYNDLEDKFTKEELSKVAASCAQDLAKQIGSKLKYMVLHLDEKTPHFHFALKNFDDNGMSIFHKIKHKDILSKIQDIAFEHFGKLGMDRGVSKDITGKNYRNIGNYYKQQEIELRAIIQSLQAEVKQIQSSKKDILNNLDLTKSEKKQELDKLDLELKDLRNTIKEYKEIIKDYEVKLEKLETLNKDINVANDTLIGLNKQITTKEVEVNNFNNIDKSVEKQVDKIINDLIENPLTLLGKDAILDIDTLKDKTKQELRKAFKIDIKSKELEEKDKAIKDLKDKLQNKDEVLEKVMTEKYEAINENKLLKQENKKLNQDNLSKTNEITKLKENHTSEIKRLRNDLKQQIALRVKRLNLINRLKRSNIADKIRLRLSKGLNSNTSLNQRDR